VAETNRELKDTDQALRHALARIEELEQQFNCAVNSDQNSEDEIHL